jgi:16S rRNA (cytosine967-C5)-methyltransferase
MGLVASNIESTEARTVVPLVADALAPPFAAASFDRVLVDAPCSGLGVLRRRADARWRIEPDDVAELAALQRRMVVRAADLVRPGGVLVYSVCTLTAEETIGVDEHLAAVRPDLTPLEPPGDPWIPWGRGALLLPQAADTDGMMILRLQRRADPDRPTERR